MNLFQPAVDAIKKFIPTVFRLSDAEFINGNRLGRIFGVGSGTDGTEAEIYKSHPWTYAAINAIARSISGVPFVFQTAGGRAKGNHAFVEVFERPNRWQGLGQFIESVISWWHLHGKVIIVMRRSSDSEVPKEMIADDPSKWEPVFSKDTARLVGWVKHLDNGETVPFRLHEVIFLKFWNPDDEFDGLSPISAARQGITNDLMANQFNTNFFKNSGSPGGVIEMDENLTDEQFNRLVAQYEDRHSGAENAHKMLILEGGAKFKQSSMTAKDMEFLNQKKWNRDETLAVFNVPKLEVGIIEDGANLAVIKMQSREFWLKNLIPKMKLLEWALWSQLFQNINGGRIWAEFDTSGIESLQDEFNEKVATARKLWEMGYTMNQINARMNLGMPENSWQHSAFIPVNVIPIAVDESGKPIITPDTSNPGQDPLQKPDKGPTDESREGKEKPPPAPTPAQIGTAATATTAGKELEAALTKKLRAFFYKQRVRQLKLSEQKSTALLSLDHEEVELSKHLGKYLDVTTLLQVNEFIHGKKLEIVTLNFETRDQIIPSLKHLYNSTGQQVPVIVAELLKRMDKDQIDEVSNILNIELCENV